MQLEIVVDKSGERVLAVKGQSGQFRVPGFLSRQASQSRPVLLQLQAATQPAQENPIHSFAFLFCLFSVTLVLSPLNTSLLLLPLLPTTPVFLRQLFHKLPHDVIMISPH